MNEVEELFKVPSKLVKISRKDAQNLATNQKKRVAYANIQ